MMARACGTLYALLIAALLALAGCQTVDPPPPQNLLSVQLDDSLKQYDRVLVQVFDRDSSSRLLKTLWNGPLKAPGSDIAGFDMKDFGTTRFIVKVSGFKAGGQLALQTRIFYEPPPGRQTVLHDSVPPLIPQNWLESLKPSVGAMFPDFNRDSLHYQIKMPEKMDSLNFILTAPYPGVVIQLNGGTVASGVATKFIKIGVTPETVFARVTDTGTGTAATREYQLIVFPTLPQGVSLATLVPSQGRLGTEFSPQNTVYNLYMEPNKDTVSFLATSADPPTMYVYYDGIAALPGQRSQVFTVAKGTTYTLPITVHRGSDIGYYQITLDHTQGSSH